MRSVVITGDERRFTRWLPARFAHSPDEHAQTGNGANTPDDQGTDFRAAQ
jgi:hypothetical protein